MVDEPEMPQHADRGEYGAEACTDMLGTASRRCPYGDRVITASQRRRFLRSCQARRHEDRTLHNQVIFVCFLAGELGGERGKSSHVTCHYPKQAISLHRK